MEPRYSLVMFCPDIEEEIFKEIESYLLNGIKVVLFTIDSLESFEERPLWQKALKERFLEAYEVPYREEWAKTPARFYDGKIKNLELWRYLCDNSSFNEEQYMIEHYDPDVHLMVKAGAGTGKTTALINRILFLKHMDPQFTLEQLALITFTNAATLQMRQRLVERLTSYYHLTKHGRYLSWLKEVYQLQISTIHSFAQKILDLSGELGISRGMDIRTFEADKKRLLEEAIDAFAQQYPEQYRPFRFKPYYQLVEAALQMYEALQNRALSTEKVADLDFGEQENHHAFFFSYLIKRLDRELEQIKEKNRQIEVNDLIRRLDRLDILQLKEKFPFRYVMVDEFQDTDPVQVSFLLKLVQGTNCRLLVVGDVKQSIYRFRGADYTAFQQLEEGLIRLNHSYQPISLVKNYRSSPKLLNQLNGLFTQWPKLIPTFTFGLDDRLVPMAEGAEKDEGLVCLPLDKTNLKYLLSRLQGEETAILVRSNQDVQEMIEQIESLGFFCEGIRTGKFYRSLPVREFYQMLLCLIHPEVSLYQYARHRSSYGANTLTMQKVIDAFTPQRDYLADLLKQEPDYAQWITYAQRAQREQLLHLLQEIVAQTNPAQVFAQRSFIQMRRDHPEQDQAIQQKEAKVRGEDYQNNLDYLFYLLQKHFTDHVMTLAGIERFLRIKMTTDTVETGVLPDEKQISHRFRVMTVHQAKGLEFDHVILPITEHSFDHYGQPEIFVTPKDNRLLVSYKLFIDGQAYENVYYRDFMKKENMERYGEESRLLYVALTRAKRNVYAHVHGKKKGRVSSWHHLLQERDGNHVQSGDLLQPTPIL